jgi:drug/metabolite transporter (DMT)-like permease
VNDGWAILLGGQAACLAAASLWAVAVGLFRRPIQKYGARSINLAKCLLAAALQGVTVWILGQTGALFAAPGRSLIFIAISGLVGLVLGDTALFAAVARIGAHRTLLLQTLAPVFTAVIALVWQGELLSLPQAAGGLLILTGIGVVVAPAKATREGQNGSAPASSRTAIVAGGVALGYVVGVIAAFGQGAGVVLAKVGMLDLPVVAASFLRLGAAALGLLVLEAVTGRLGTLRRLVRDGACLTRAVPATLLGTYLALFLMMAGVAYAPASVAAVLLGTSPVFSLFLEAAFNKNPITARGLVGTLLSVAGVAVLSLF